MEEKKIIIVLYRWYGTMTCLPFFIPPPTSTLPEHPNTISPPMRLQCHTMPKYNFCITIRLRINVKIIYLRRFILFSFSRSMF